MPHSTLFPARDVKVRAIRYLNGVYLEYQPEIGKVYDGKYRRSSKNCASFCVIPVLDKQIVLRQGEFEIVGGLEDGNVH